jgi:adenine phosphoribosyltransferase
VAGQLRDVKGVSICVEGGTFLVPALSSLCHLWPMTLIGLADDDEISRRSGGGSTGGRVWTRAKRVENYMTVSTGSAGPAEVATRIRELVRVVPDFPRAGIAFQDLAPLYAEPGVLRSLGEHLAGAFADDFDAVVAIEARGFVIGTAVALSGDRPLVLARKKGKLPGIVTSIEYALEYCVEVLEMQHDAVAPGTRVLVVDDVLATGGTFAGTASLVAGMGGQVVGFGVVLEIAPLGGRARLASTPVAAVVSVGAAPAPEA